VNLCGMKTYFILCAKLDAVCNCANCSGMQLVVFWYVFGSVRGSTFN
jgi:hypothetical protein